MLRTHLRAVLASSRAILALLEGLNNAFDLPLLTTLPVHPLRVIARIGIQLAGPAHSLRLLQQFGRLFAVIARPNIYTHGQGQQAGAPHDHRKLHELAALAALAAAEVFTGG